MSDNRETIGSRLGFILLSAGCAIGLGNIWKFPYVCGENGGAVFLIAYFICLVFIAIPVLSMEFTLGRAARKSPVHLYQVLEKPGSKWHWHGYITLVALTLLMMYYTSVTGWLVCYFFKMAAGDFVGVSGDKVVSQFGELLSSPKEQLLVLAGVIFSGFAVCSIGLQKGLERVSKIIMLALFAIMIVLAVRSVFLPGGEAGLAFYLKPDWTKVDSFGEICKVMSAAMMQSFFTLSLGIGSMAIFGSYIGKDRSLLGESVTVAALDTFVAVSAGLIIFPACFAYGVKPEAGPPLIFQALPNVFSNMESGRLWGTLFFIFLTFAAFSTVIAVFEGIMASVGDLTGWGRKKCAVICCPLLYILSVPCVLGYNLWSGFEPLGKGSTVLDLEDFIVSNLCLPLGALVFVLFCTTKAWGWKNFTEEANQGRGLKIRQWMRIPVSVVLPIVFVVIFLMGLIEKFA